MLSPQIKLLLHRWENGPGGIRTRIRHCDRVLCSPYTTGPEVSVSDGPENRKEGYHQFYFAIPNWNESRIPAETIRRDIAPGHRCHVDLRKTDAGGGSRDGMLSSARVDRYSL